MLYILFRNRILCGLAVVIVALFSSCQKEVNDNLLQPIYNVNLHFVPKVGAADLEFGAQYINAAGEPFSIKNFKFYISGIQLSNDQYSETFSVGSDSFFLVDFTKGASTVLQLKTKPFTYNRISFIIGVDSLHNVSGAQSGALDPANGMFWTWNSGYIMAKLEGNSLVSAQPNNLFEYHIGGFAGENKVQETVTFNLPAGKQIVTEGGGFSDVTIGADAAKWFSGKSTISIAALPAITTPGPAAKVIADNYAQMFSVQEIINQ